MKAGEVIACCNTTEATKGKICALEKPGTEYNGK